MKQFYQDGRDFYDANGGGPIISYPELVKDDHDITGAKLARERFMQEHPDYEPVADPFETNDERYQREARTPGTQAWAETRGDDLGESPDY